MTVMEQYYQIVTKLLSTINESQAETVDLVARWVAESIENDGIIHIFGCGHSHMIGEEVFYRAGGIVPINPILDPGLMLHEGAAKSSQLERFEGYAPLLLDNYDVQPHDLLIVVSNSGINAGPIDMALRAKELGLKVAVITSSHYFGEKSRHSSGKLLYQVGDVYIDSLVPKGDAAVNLPDSPLRMGPTSTMAVVFIIHSVMLKAAQQLAEKGITPPVFASNNVEGGEAHNRQYLEKYKGRLKHL